MKKIIPILFGTLVYIIITYYSFLSCFFPEHFMKEFDCYLPKGHFMHSPMIGLLQILGASNLLIFTSLGLTFLIVVIVSFRKVNNIK